MSSALAAIPTTDQIVVLRNIPWTQYDAICAAREDAAGPRMAYREGVLEIASPGRRHEYKKTLMARLIEAFAEERDLALNGFGSETFRAEAKDAGVEPDECYCIGSARPVPDVAIEVVETHGEIDKLVIYARLEIPEVWFLAKGRFHVHRLGARGYRRLERSVVLRDLDLEELARIVESTDESHQTQAVRAFRRSLRRR